MGVVGGVLMGMPYAVNISALATEFIYLWVNVVVCLFEGLGLVACIRLCDGVHPLEYMNAVLFRPRLLLYFRSETHFFFSPTGGARPIFWGKEPVYWYCEKALF